MALMNMSNEEQVVNLETGETYRLAPWQYEIMEK
jgi:hypothetical protein